MLTYEEIVAMGIGEEDDDLPVDDEDEDVEDDAEDEEDDM